MTLRKRLILFLLKILGHREDPLPHLHLYVLITPGDRLADTTINRHRAVAMARAAEAQGKPIELWRYQATAQEKFR